MPTFSTLFAATLLTLCVGLQVLEASGQWDRTVKDTGDEAVIVAIVLCIGSALVVARARRHRFSLTRVVLRAGLIPTTAENPSIPPPVPTCRSSPSVGLRI